MYRLYSNTDVPYWKHENITYLPQETYFTAVLQLGDMFSGGGVPIDYYIIQVENDTELETTDPTYSFNISYHTTLLVNISAHNCAGYSFPITLEIHHDQMQGTHFVTFFTITIIINISMFYCADADKCCATPTSPVVTVAVSVTVSIVSTIIAILGLVALCKLFQWYTKSSKWRQLWYTLQNGIATGIEPLITPLIFVVHACIYQ